ncbi:hypothetical protein BAZSYMA_ACONTIG228273_0 [Bathymodiolus azoricus thioautotrophic gill symbiont]|uniref:Uncharacterized protein n=1 Tax=Bathymodiolus azoricus thioautotrophic gill symbiont TaxID=235205 RepID=A0A1H6MGL5_9GAMM|nr:hypothetical protein BAZSYMA_ACONTIG228273_0 [Bathymodiolus azoricus thioautotrophic gill symbiont]
MERNERGYCTSPKIIHKNTIFIHKVAILLLFQTFPQSKNKNQTKHTNPNWHNDFNQKTVSPIR